MCVVGVEGYGRPSTIFNARRRSGRAVERQVAVVHLQRQQAQRGRRDPAALPGADHTVRRPATLVRAGLRGLEFDEPVAHAALAGAVRALGPLVPVAPLVALEEVNDLRRVVVVVHVQCRVNVLAVLHGLRLLRCTGRRAGHEADRALRVTRVGRLPARVVPAKQADGREARARPRAVAVRVAVGGLPRAGPGEVEELDGLLDDLRVHHDVLAQTRGLERLNLPADDRGVAGAGRGHRVAPTPVDALLPLDVVDRGLRAGQQHAAILRHAIGLARAGTPMPWAYMVPEPVNLPAFAPESGQLRSRKFSPAVTVF